MGLIPDFDVNDVLPPFVGDPARPDGSPYLCSLITFVDRFASSAERVAILEGFLGYRAQLHALGLVKGFHWLDGSFAENIDVIRAPNDIDVVTFFRPPPTWADPKLRSDAISLLRPARAKADFKCDAYLVNLLDEPERVVWWTRYWFGLFSHKRATYVWKGMVQVDLDPAEDSNARSQLASALARLTGAP